MIRAPFFTYPMSFLFSPALIYRQRLHRGRTTARIDTNPDPDRDPRGNCYLGRGTAYQLCQCVITPAWIERSERTARTDAENIIGGLRAKNISVIPHAAIEAELQDFPLFYQ